MGDKSPKSKQRDKKQKEAAKTQAQKAKGQPKGQAMLAKQGAK